MVKIEAQRLSAAEVATYDDIDKMRSGGKDRYSMMDLRQLCLELTERSEEVVHAMNIAADEYAMENQFATWTDKELACALRWHMRGCKLELAVRRAQLDTLRAKPFSLEQRALTYRYKSGHDELSGRRLEDLRSDEPQMDGVESLFVKLWHETNQAYGREFALTDAVMASIWRWYKRGLLIPLAVGRVWMTLR